MTSGGAGFCLGVVVGWITTSAARTFYRWLRRARWLR